MQRTRVIPSLLLDNDSLYKTLKFKNPKYIGDPINAVKIFNTKEVDELILLDFTASIEKRSPNFKNIKEIVSEAFMPIGYGGGISSINDIDKLFKIGIEKIIINTSSYENQNILLEAIKIYGSQSIVISLDYKRDFFGNYNIYTRSGTVKQKDNILKAALKFQSLGVGELILNSIDRDGIMKGYDYDNLTKVCNELSIPVIASGGAGSIDDLRKAVDCGASAVAAGSLFVFQGIHRAVLLSYISSDEVMNKIF